MATRTDKQKYTDKNVYNVKSNIYVYIYNDKILCNIYK